ncbi:MAG: alpha/beta family hydrolase [Bacteroidia bacterium]
MALQTSRYTFLATPEKGEVSALLLKPENPEFLLVLGHGAGAGWNMIVWKISLRPWQLMELLLLRYQFPIWKEGGRDSQAVSLETVASAVQFAHQLEPNLPLLAGGHSFGGRMTSLAAAQDMIPTVKGLVFCSFPLHAPGKPGIERAGHLPDIKVPMLFLSGTRDTFLNLDLFMPLLENIRHHATLHLLDTANHGYKILKRTRKSEEDVFAEMGRVAGEWVAERVGV